MSKALPDTSGSWYEASLPLHERKQRGHFSTPAPLVERILDACGYTPANDLTNLRVLDPACGSGNFLAGAARRLLTFAEHKGYTRDERVTLVQRNIWGFDPDPVSCFLSEMQLNDVIRSRESSIVTAMSSSALACTDAMSSISRFHIHQTDALALPWEPCVDLFLANPPYLAAKNIDLSGYRSAQNRGQMDSYLLFLSLGMQIVRPNGWLGLVLPDPLLARANAAHERALLLQNFTIHQLWHLSATFAAQVGAVVLIAQKTRAEFRYLLGSTHNSILNRLHTYLDEQKTAPNPHFVPLGQLLSIHRGEELGRKSQHLLPMEMNPKCQAPTYPLLRGGIDIRPYTTPVGNWSIAREHIAKPLDRYLAPKILVVKSTAQLQTALDLQGHVVLQTLYILHLRENVGAQFIAPAIAAPDIAMTGATMTGAMNCAPTSTVDDLYFFLALLNSGLLKEYVYMLHTAYKWVQPQIEQHVLANLPIPIVTVEQKQDIIDRAKRLVALCSCSRPNAVVEWDEMMRTAYAEQERAICSLYDAMLL
jgi:methylase of polypeptide subunit release factors